MGRVVLLGWGISPISLWEIAVKQRVRPHEKRVTPPSAFISDIMFLKDGGGWKFFSTFLCSTVIPGKGKIKPDLFILSYREKPLHFFCSNNAQFVLRLYEHESRCRLDVTSNHRNTRNDILAEDVRVNVWPLDVIAFHSWSIVRAIATITNTTNSHQAHWAKHDTEKHFCLLLCVSHEDEKPKVSPLIRTVLLCLTLVY